MLYVTCQYGDINTSVKSGEMVLTLYRLCWHYIDFQFLSQSLVKAKCTRLRGRIVHIPGMDQETGHAGNGDNMTMVALDHCWKEFLGKKEMRDCVYIKDSADFHFHFVEGCLIGSNSCIVD